MNEEKKKAIEKLKEAQDRMIKPKMLKDVKYTNEDYAEAIDTILNLIEKQQKEIEEIRQWKYVIDTYEDSDKLKELDLIKIKGKKYIAEKRLQEFKDLLLKELDRDFVTEEYRQGISCYFKKLLEE